MGEGQDGRRGALHQEHGHCARAFAPAREDPLFRARGRRHQGRHRRLEEKARRRSARPRKGLALIVSGAAAARAFLVVAQHAAPLLGTIESRRVWHLKMATEVATPNVAKIHLTERAPLKIRPLLQKQGVSPDVGGLRVGVQGGGSSGLSYAMRLDTQARDRDKIFEEFGARLFVDPKSFLYLNGTTLEYEETLMREGFVFQNPNAARNCGCGSSFTA